VLKDSLERLLDFDWSLYPATDHDRRHYRPVVFPGHPLKRKQELQVRAMRGTAVSVSSKLGKSIGQMEQSQRGMALFTRSIRNGNLVLSGDVGRRARPPRIGQREEMVTANKLLRSLPTQAGILKRVKITNVSMLSPTTSASSSVASGERMLLFPWRITLLALACSGSAILGNLKILERGLALYDPSEHGAHIFLYSQDPKTVSLSYQAWALWFLGYPEQAWQCSREAIEWAREVAHPFSLAFAWDFAAEVPRLRREAEETQQRAEAAIAIGMEQDFRFDP
jgi:hypothetical protein